MGASSPTGTTWRRSGTTPSTTSSVLPPRSSPSSLLRLPSTPRPTGRRRPRSCSRPSTCPPCTSPSRLCSPCTPPAVPLVSSWTPVTVSPTVSPSTRVTLSPTPSSVSTWLYAKKFISNETNKTWLMWTADHLASCQSSILLTHMNSLKLVPHLISHHQQFSIFMKCHVPGPGSCYPKLLHLCKCIIVLYPEDYHHPHPPAAHVDTPPILVDQYLSTCVVLHRAEANFLDHHQFSCLVVQPVNLYIVFNFTSQESQTPLLVYGQMPRTSSSPNTGVIQSH